LKIVVIGGGSSYTPELVSGIIDTHCSFPVSEIALVDLGKGAARQSAVAGLCRRMIWKAGLDGRIMLDESLDRSAALPGADFVISQFRTGGGEARLKDELLPLPYGIVGQESTGPGGFAAALRQIPPTLALAADMERLCPDAFLINFTNPSGIITGALKQQSTINCAGLCNIPWTMRKIAAVFLGQPPEKLELTFSGLNHLSWVTRLSLDGADITGKVIAAPETALFLGRDFPEIASGEIERLLGALEVLPSPYLLYYYFPKQTFAAVRQQAAAGTNRARQVLALEKELFELYRDPGLDEKPAQLSQRGGALYSEAAVALMKAIHCGNPVKQVLNTRNDGALPELPADAVIETNCLVRGQEIRALPPGPLSAARRGLVQQVSAYEQLTIEAAITGERRAAYLALLNHPLVGSADLAAALLDRILKENRSYLTRFSQPPVGRRQ
jgi:6-phospho-beta-glucosidase